MKEDFSASAVTGWEDANEAQLTVRFGDEVHANAFARRLGGASRVRVGPDGDGWEVEIEGAKTGQFVVQVLEAVRQALAGNQDAYALVNLDGREYRLDGE
jgi:hypothetical protein